MPKPIGHKISKKQVRSLLQDSLWIVDTELSSQSTIIYRNIDGRVLVHLLGGNGFLIDSEQSEIYINQLRTAQTKANIWQAENPRGRHILVGRLPQGREFATQVPALTAELPSLLKLSPNDLDLSEASLAKIDPKLKHIGRTKCLEAPLFPALVAYIGEIMRRKYGGEWYMRHHEVDTRVWEPWLIIRGGRVCNIAPNLYDALNERSLSVSDIIGGPYIWWHPPSIGFWKETDGKS